MLHIYDILNSSKLLALAAAGGLTLTGFAQAQTGCDLDNGYAQSLSAYSYEMHACLDQAPLQNAEMVESLLDAINHERSAAHVQPVSLRTSLSQAAQAHGLDMAQRKFIDHFDLEGRDHMYRIRTLDRTQLTGATGANVILVPADISAMALFDQLHEDPQNRANLTQERFTHIGIGLVERADQLFVTILFTEMAGELKHALPVHFHKDQRIRADLTNPMAEAVGWGLTDLTSQEQYARGINPILTTDRLQQVTVAGLDIFVARDTLIKNVRGPMISASEF